MVHHEDSHESLRNCSVSPERQAHVNRQTGNLDSVNHLPATYLHRPSRLCGSADPGRPTNPPALRRPLSPTLYLEAAAPPAETQPGLLEPEYVNWSKLVFQSFRNRSDWEI